MSKTRDQIRVFNYEEDLNTWLDKWKDDITVISIRYQATWCIRNTVLSDGELKKTFMVHYREKI